MSQPFLALAPFQAFIDALPDATLLIDQQHAIRFANRQVKSLFGYTTDELQGLDIDLLVPERFRESHQQKRQRYMQNPTVRLMDGDLVLFARRKDGSEFPVDIGLSPVETELGMMVICSVRDVSHAKMAEQALIHAELFKLFLRHTPAAIAMFDRNMRYLTVSQRWIDDYDLGQRNLIGLSHYDVFPDLPDHWREGHQRCLAGETLQSDEAERVALNGRNHWITWKMCPWYAGHGEIGGLILFADIVTARKQGELKQRRSETQFRRIFDNAVAGIAITDIDGTFQYCNAAYVALTGYTLQELTHLRFSDLIHPDDLQDNLDQVRRLIEGDCPYFVIENRYVTKTGDAICVRKYGSLLSEGVSESAQLIAVVLDINQLRETEQHLRDSFRKLASSEAMFRSLIENMPQMAWLARPDGVMEYANQRWLEYRGPLKPQDSVSAWYVNVHPADLESVIAAWDDANRRQAHFTLECRLRQADGAFRWWQVRGVLLEQGEALRDHWLMTSTDIHDLKREGHAMDQLNAACFRLWQMNNLEEGLYEMLMATVNMLQADFGNVQLLTAAGDLTIVAQHGFTQRLLDGFQHVTPSTPSACELALSQGKRYIIENVERDVAFAPFRANARQAGFCAMQSTPLFSHNGSAIGIISTHFRSPHSFDAFELSMLDIYAQQAASFIDRCRAEIKVRDSETYFRRIFDNALVGIAICDKSGRFIDGNGAFCHMLGYSRDEICQLGLSHVLYPDDAKLMLDNVEKLFAGELPFLQIEIRNISKSAEVLWVSKYLSLLPTDHSRSEKLLTIVSDITPLKHTEAELLTIKQQLELTVDTRTRQLDEARISAEKANAFKTRFLNAASHDLRQPLQSAGLYLSVLSKKVKADDCRHICHSMNDSLAVMGGILDALLDLSRIESESIAPSRRDVRVRALIDRVVTTFGPQAAAKGLVLEADGDDCVIHSDPALLERIVGNFTCNAIRYTEQGKVTVESTCGTTMARISVTDTGIGIASDQLGRIFEAYYQINNSERDHNKGLGLGLAITKHIADILGVTLHVESIPGNGSVFSVDVPLGKTTVRQAQDVARNTAISLQSPLQILFIDDDPAISKAAKLLFEAHGIIGHYTLSGEEALSVVAEGMRPQLVVTDYQLSGWNGIETLQRIRAIVGDLPAAIITGDTVAAQTLGGMLTNTTVFTKPLDADRLMAWVNDCLQAFAQQKPG
ncbi:PAS domain S-box protein [Methylomonas sp. SURF-2]|uniref:histidine kinase n=1 Tax=Methylomonas subterranea TaxID=2952225 RepID=A0ABT1TE74_9GAMM|nr:PAS domain S-box protein [Methylomonas sp. SURF-2]MCQ8103762.1 PAS domain S-box protein [Methylomonas sp. SURF-2]